MLSTTYRYDDPDHLDRVTSVVQSPEYTHDDWALLLGLEMCEAEEKATTTECGWPMELAYHADTDGFWERRSFKCHVCSEGRDEAIYHDHVTSTLPPDRELTPFVLGVTTESP